MAPPAVDMSTLRELYSTPPAQFVATRTRLVKERKAAKDREGAAALGKLRKPTLTDWALNVVAVEHSDDVAAFLDAAATLREAQAAAIEGRDGPDVRDALRDLRDHSGRVLAHAQDVLAGAGRDVAAEAGTIGPRLTEIAANPDAAAQLAAGALGSSLAGAEELFGGLEPVAAPKAKKTKAAKTAKKATKPPSRAARPSAAEQREEARREKERQRAEAEARRARDAAAKQLARAEDAMEKAAAAFRNAERRLEEARAALTSAGSERDEAAAQLNTAEATLRSVATRS